MAMDELARFCTEYLPKHPELKNTVDARGDERFAALAALGRKAGFDFSAGDVRDVLTASPSVDLSDDELDRAAGGLRSGGPQREYYVVVLREVLASSTMSGTP
jgi:hypothetical protein